MAGTGKPGPDSPHTWDWNTPDFARLYFTKEEANTLVMKVAALNHTADLMKVALAGLATGLTVVKADFSLFKVDEKGVSILGNARYTFPWAEEGDNWFWKKAVGKAKVEELERLTVEKEKEKKEHEELKKQPEKLRTYMDKTFYRKSRAGELNKRINHAQNSADRVGRDITALRSQLRNAGGASGGLPANKSNQAINATQRAVNKLSQALAGI
ncbi:hypothetical protein ACNPQM_08155 [Streptomyces sp. NPDC056231]|uniref:hypothetical protein n=1 Tax=Streptomyces sp. NPDC056231 TaxID=3345755 RepID=UPI003AAC5FB1